MRTARAILPLLILLAPAGAQAQGAANLAPHRAVYDLELESASDSSGISDISGRMVYEFRGTACEGYTTSFRFVTQIDTNDATRLTDQQTTTFEDSAGENFSFATKSFVDRNLDREIRGEATREGDALKVNLDKPQASEVILPATQFPTQHMLELLDHAREGETFYETTLFDGSDEADKVMTTTVVIGTPRTGNSSDPEFSALKALGSDTYWPVNIAYFDLVGDGGEELPDYRISFKLHANGLTRDLVMDYGDFSMKGRLVDLDLFDPAQSLCPELMPKPAP